MNGPIEGVKLDLLPFGHLWLTALFALAAAAVVWLAYRARLRQKARSLRLRNDIEHQARERLADELNDTLLQGVQGLVLLFTAATALVPEESPARKLMDRALDQAQQIIVRARDQLVDIHAFRGAHLGLGRALISTAEEFALLGKTTFLTSVECDETRIRSNVAEDCYRIGREALFNAVRHSGAGSILLTVECAPAGLTMIISDDGRGIDPEVLKSGRPGHWGLESMRQRANRLGGSLSILSPAAGGTVIEAFVPAPVAFYRSGRFASWFSRGWR